MSILIYAENQNGKLSKSAKELASYAKVYADRKGKQVVALAIGVEQPEELYQYGVSKVLNVTNNQLTKFNAYAYADVIKQAADQLQADLVLFSDSNDSVYLGPLLAVKWDAAYVTHVIDVPEEFSGTVIERLGKRKAEMKSMLPMGQGFQRIEFEIPARALIGFRGQFLTDTKGEGVMNHSFLEFRPFSGEVESRSYGALISMTSGSTLAFSLFGIQNRGVLFVGVQTEVYEGMIIGEHNQGTDLVVNPIRAKKQTNVRSSGKDEAINLTPPLPMSLEIALEYIDSTEYVEITPLNIRIRKRWLTETERKRNGKKN